MSFELDLERISETRKRLDTMSVSIVDKIECIDLIKVIKAFEVSQQCKLSPASLELILNAGAKAIYEGNGIRYGLGSDWSWDYNE